MARLAVGVALLTATWLLVLPAVSRQTPLRHAIERNKSHGVNANAMYYTELEGVRFLDLWRSPSRSQRTPIAILIPFFVPHPAVCPFPGATET
jgi:hypothetical protein